MIEKLRKATDKEIETFIKKLYADHIKHASKEDKKLIVAYIEKIIAKAKKGKEIKTLSVHEGIILYGKIADDTYYVYALYVNADYRKLGIGKFLLEAVIKKAFEEKGINNIKLRVISSNKGALKLYRKYGFKIIEKRKINNIDLQYIMKKNKED